MSLSLKKRFRQKMRLVIQKLPQFIQGRIYRNMLCLTDRIPEDLTFKVAESKEELEEAFKLVYESYKGVGIIDELDEKLWMTKYQLMPTTTILIAKWKQQIIATACIIVDSPLGIPVEEVADLTKFREKGYAISEVSSVAIHKDFRKMNPGILMPLWKYIYEYSYYFAGIDILVATIHQSVKGYFKHVLQFTELPRKEGAKKYSQVKDSNPATLMIDLNTLIKRYKKVYKNAPNEKNLYRYYVEVKFHNFNFGENPIPGAVNPVMKPSYLDYFLSKKPSIFKQLGEQEVQMVGSSYFYGQFKEVLSKHFCCPISSETRSNLRVLYNKTVEAVDHSNNEQIVCKLRDISKHGIRFRCEKDLTPGTILTIDIPVKETHLKSVSTNVEVLWKRNCLFGCRIVDINESNWLNFVELLEERFLILAK
ncbi:MAG: PilZ domain-containing protein [Bdellovibrionales bacterium]|nr:PilZ domain-containing protein [Bdellovibrionales bacterium]